MELQCAMFHLTAVQVNEACFRKGLLMFAPVGVGGECIKIAPTLDTTREALEEGIAVLDESMDEVLARSANAVGQGS